MNISIKSISTLLVTLMAALAAIGFDRDDNSFEFYLSSNRIYSPGDKDVSVGFSGRVDRHTTISMHTYRIADPVAFFVAQANPHAPGHGSDSTDAIDLRDHRQFIPLSSWDYTLSSRDKYWQYENIPLQMNEKGVYLVQASARGKVATTVVVITELGMIMKQANGQVLAFVVNRKSGEKVTGLPVTFERGPKSKTTATTGSDGVAKTVMDMSTDNAGGDEFDGGYGNQIVAVGGRGDDFVICDSYFYRTYGRNGASSVVYLHTDRPVYRPSQTVYYRGIVRSVTEAGTYENVDTGKAYVEVTDARGGSLKKDTLRISDFGTFSGDLTLGEEPPLGNYTITVNIGGQTSSFSFDVQEYKKPEYEVTVKTDHDQYTRGDEIKATVNAKYYFGSPVSEGTVQYFIYRSRYWRPWWYRSEWAYLYEDAPEYMNSSGMQMVNSGEGKLNADGTFSVSYQTDGKADDDYVYRIQANVVDASRRSIAGTASARVTRGEFYVSARTSKYVYKPQEEVRVNVETIAFDGEKPISAPFSVKVERVWWEGRTVRRNEPQRATIWTGSGSTDGNGSGSVTFNAKDPGYYTVYVTAKDHRGTEIGTSSSVYVSDGYYSYWNNDGGDVQVIPDREMYKPGETMSALVIMPQPNIDVLVTSEATTLYSYQVERLSSTSAVIRVPIVAQHAPMFYLNVSALAADNFYNANHRIVVTPEGKLIRLEVKMEKETFKPGEKGTVTVRAVDAGGEPVGNVDVALGMVDEAIYAIHADETPDIQKFFYGSRWNHVSTNSSLNFSFWAASRRAMARDGVMASGASRKEALMDRSENAPPPPPAAAPQYKTADDLVQPVVRTDFRDQMYWTPSVRTDTRGYATVNVTFPDNLTTWRITARGITKATAVGQARATVIERKDLLVRMETPRFITQGDQLSIATTIHNYLGGEKKTKVVFEAEGVEFAGHEQTVTIPANGEKRIDWTIKAPKVGQAKLTVKALTNEESDAMQLTVPILPQGVLTGSSAIADMDEQTRQRTLALSLPTNSDPSTGTLSIALSPSAASSILGALDELVGYPYGCVEQTMSRFLPTVMVADVLKKLDVPFDPQKREELPKMVEKGFTRLYGLQHDDGGWGWWEHDQTNPFMTAYVMYGLTVARNAGYTVNNDRYENGRRALRALIEARRAGGGLGSDDKRLAATTEAYMLYVACFINRGTRDALYDERINALARRDDINNYAVALLAMASHYESDNATANRLAERLEKAATVSATGAQWNGKSWHYNWQDDAVETSASAVKALLEIRGETELVKKGIHFLLAQKQGDAWRNTRQTAMVVYALADYVRSTHELEPDYTVHVRVNGREVFTQHITKADIFAPEKQIKVERSALHTGDNTIEIEKSGSGKLYATARLNYFATGPALAAADAGFKVTREYSLLRRDWKDGQFIYRKMPYTGQVKSGDEVFVKVKITPSARYEYFLLEDPLPAGCEVVKNTDGYNIPGESGYGEDNNDYRRYGFWAWRWWYADRDVRDEKVAFFAREMEPQTYEFSYIMRAQIPGTYSVMPSVGMLMYYPEVRGNSGSLAMKIAG
ncbi:MAG: hypothetical protein JST22_10655 [Bacteroidetes bacterium]|nr:hypothetical protein [Bacteroidota bacterium]